METHIPKNASIDMVVEIALILGCLALGIYLTIFLIAGLLGGAMLLITVLCKLFTPNKA